MEIKHKIDKLVSQSKVEWKKHALQRIFERDITRDEVIQAIREGSIIESYFDDYPYPSFLIAHVDTGKPLHIVLSLDEESKLCYIITVYKPDIKYFQEDLITRRDA